MSKVSPIERLGRRVRQLRRAAGLTQEQLAERAGITWHYVSAIERGARSATFDTLLSLSSALGVTLSELVLDVERPSSRELTRVETAVAGQPAAARRAILDLVQCALRVSVAAEATAPYGDDLPPPRRR
jgi:transcriptional regulator with XRE-family HTH domain